MALRSDDNLITLVLRDDEAIDLLIAVEFELAIRCKPGQAMTGRLQEIQKRLCDRLGLDQGHVSNMVHTLSRWNA